METCKAVIQEGARRGEQCKFPPSESNSYCGRHQRNFEHAKLIEEGKQPCRFFFRGCNSILEENEMSPSCKLCREKLSKKSTPCSHDGCNFKTDGSKYCKKHTRDVYRDEEKEKGIQYCDIARGCFTILEGGTKSCKSCLEAANKTEVARYEKRRELNNALTNLKNTLQQICVKCGKDFEKYLTAANNQSKLCKHCNEIQRNQDAKRVERVRISKEEKLKNIPSYYKEYIRTAIRKERVMELQFDEFVEMVQKPCYYCNTIKDNEANGIDRVDNTKGYTKENSVPCCGTCNRLKLYYHPLFFVEKCKIISKQNTEINQFVSKWKEYYTRCKDESYIGYKNKSEIERNLEFKLTEEDWNELMDQACYLCGYKNKNRVGIDRVDNTIREYNKENTKACCGSCNLMKGETQLSELLEKAQQITDNWSDVSSLECIPQNKGEIQSDLKKMRNNLLDSDERKTWKALGAYYSIMSNSDDFYETQKDIYPLEKYNKLKDTIMTSPKHEAVLEIKRVLVALKKKRARTSITPVSK